MKTKLFRQPAVQQLLLVFVLSLLWHAGMTQQDEKPLTRLIYDAVAGQTVPVYDLFERSRGGAGYHEADEYLRTYTPLVLKHDELNRLRNDNPALIKMQLSTRETPLTVILMKYDPLGPDFTAGTLQGDHEERVEEYEPGLYYRGIVEDDPTSMVVYSFFEDEVQGLIMT